MLRSNRSRGRATSGKKSKVLNRSRNYRRKRNIRVLIGCLVLLIVGAGIGFYVWQMNSEDKEVDFSGYSLDVQLQSEVKEASSQQTLQELLEKEEQEDADFLEMQAQSYVDDMSVAEKVGAMFMVTADDLADISIAIQAGTQTKERIQQYPVGGIHYESHNFDNIEQMTLMLNNTRVYSNTPILFAADSTIKVCVENTGSTLEEIGFQIDASLLRWQLLDDGTSVELDSVINLVEYDGSKTATELIEEGADMIYIDGAFEDIYQELLSDVQQGVISEELIDEHVLKVMKIKL